GPFTRSDTQSSTRRPLLCSASLICRARDDRSTVDTCFFRRWSCTNPAATRVSRAAEIPAHAKNKYFAEHAGTVMSEVELAELNPPDGIIHEIPTNGSTAIPIRSMNRIKNRDAEFCLPATRSHVHATAHRAMPPTNESSTCSTINGTISCNVCGSIISFPL